MKVNFRPAVSAALAQLINVAYRSGQGWTHEVELLEGTASAPQRLSASSRTWRLPGRRMGYWLAVCISAATASQDSSASIPAGWGAQPVGSSHQLARSRGRQQVILTVLRQRPELIAYYERRGYRQTGRNFPFPAHEQVGRPAVMSGHVFIFKAILQLWPATPGCCRWTPDSTW